MSFTTYWSSMSATQQNFARALFTCLRDLKEQCAQRFHEQEDIATVEPLFASPRSCIDPRHFTAAHQMDFEATELNPHSKAARQRRRERQRADYRAKRNERARRRRGHATKA